MDAMLHIIEYGDGQMFFCEFIKMRRLTFLLWLSTCWVVAHADKDHVVRTSHDHTIPSRLSQYISRTLAVINSFLVRIRRYLLSTIYLDVCAYIFDKHISN